MSLRTTLAGPLPAWDIVRRRIDVAPVVAWTLDALRELGVSASSLARLHDVIDAARALELAQALTLRSAERRPRAALHALVRRAAPEVPWERVALQARAHVRILVPGDEVAPAVLHTDHGIGHHLDERNLWIPLTPARGTRALRLLPLAPSLWVDASRRARGDAVVREAVDVAAVDVDEGEVLLFTPLHVHGASVVEDDATRVSIDVRIAPLDAAAARNPFTWIPVEAAT